MVRCIIVLLRYDCVAQFGMVLYTQHNGLLYWCGHDMWSDDGIVGSPPPSGVGTAFEQQQESFLCFFESIFHYAAADAACVSAPYHGMPYGGIGLSHAIRLMLSKYVTLTFDHVWQPKFESL